MPKLETVFRGFAIAEELKHCQLLYTASLPVRAYDDCFLDIAAFLH